jgi:hypothetical protein
MNNKRKMKKKEKKKKEKKISKQILLLPMLPSPEDILFFVSENYDN